MNFALTTSEGTNNWWNEFFEKDYKRIGVKISTGTDSALVMYFLAKFITETEQYDREIFPQTMIELNNKLSKAKEIAPNIVNLIRSKFPKVTIHDTTISEWLREGEYLAPRHKGHYFKPAQEKFVIENNIDRLHNEDDYVHLSGVTMNMPKSIRKLYGVEGHGSRDSENIGTNTHGEPRLDSKNPWMRYTKKTIAELYKQENLMDDLFMLTESCVVETEEALKDMGADSFPCKKCYWCTEKKWAFGSYDYGIV